MPTVIGLTGGIGAGKSFIAALFAELGAGVVDADAVSRGLTAAGGVAISAISRTFGADFINADGALDRNKMRETAFLDASVKLQLEAILHPLIRLEIERQIAVNFSATTALGPKYVVAEIPLLFAAVDYAARYTQIAVVDCSVQQQVERVSVRSNLSSATIMSIIAAQTPRQLRLQLANDVVCNNGENLTLRLQVAQLHEKYLKLN